MSNQITITQQEIECLRGHLTEALKVLQKLEASIGGNKAPKTPPKKRTKADMMKLIEEKEAKKRLRNNKF